MFSSQSTKQLQQLITQKRNLFDQFIQISGRQLIYIHQIVLQIQEQELESNDLLYDFEGTKDIPKVIQYSEYRVTYSFMCGTNKTILKTTRDNTIAIANELGGLALMFPSRLIGISIGIMIIFIVKPINKISNILQCTLTAKAKLKNYSLSFISSESSIGKLQQAFNKLLFHFLSSQLRKSEQCLIFEQFRLPKSEQIPASWKVNSADSLIRRYISGFLESIQNDNIKDNTHYMLFFILQQQFMIPIRQN